MAHNRMNPQQPQSGGGLGFLLPMVITLFLGVILVAVALLLPPFNLLDRLFGTQYAMLDAQSNAARTVDESLTFIINPGDIGLDFGVALDSVSSQDFLSGTANEIWVPAAKSALPKSLSPVSPIYTLLTTGTAPETVTLSLKLSEQIVSTANRDLLDLYGWNRAANQWQFIPSQSVDATTILSEINQIPEQLALFEAASPSAPTIVIAVDVTRTLTSDIGNAGTLVTPGGVQPGANGTLVGSLAAGVQTNASYQVMPVIRNFVDSRALDVGTVTDILTNDTLVDEHIQQIAVFASTFSGVFIDYRNISPENRDSFTYFITELGKVLHARNLKLGVVVPIAQNTSGVWDTGAYDWRAIGAASDYVQINMVQIDPTMFAPGTDRLVEAMLRWSVGEVNRYKILVGLSGQSQWQASGGFTPISYDEALSGLGNVEVSGELTADGGIIPGAEFTARLDGLEALTGTDESAQVSYIDYLDSNSNPVTRVWLTTDETLSFRLSRLNEFSVGGIAFTDLFLGDLADGILEAIVNYKLSLPFEPTRTALYLRWRIEDGSGIIAEATSELNTEFVATIDAPEGDYAINVAVIAESETVRGGLAIALAAPTATPTPLPSPTPRPTATPTNTPDPAEVAQAQADATRQAGQIASAPSGGGFSAVAVGPGSIAVGQFEYGGHVTSTRSARAADAMRTAGMNWMKEQIRYTPGDGTERAREVINGAREQGFKVMIGTVGSPQELAFGGIDYIRGYSQWLASIAALSPDAIEVWNEPNIDREWPRGSISGEAYVTMLREAYPAIKRANGGVLVISGAPAPTGAEAAFPGQVVNDDRFLRELVNAGGLQYLDCVGMHYNEGIVPPSATSSDPRDNYYTRYFGPMLDVYWGITGGQKPICITEIGYLSPEGYPSLPPFFAWAQNVTVAQQASWLTQVAALASQSGRVRVMIVWNIDFTRYGSDPQGGYAIIRPGGDCPACQAMANAR